MTLGFLLHPERASRLIQQKALDNKNIGLQELLDQVVKNTIQKELEDSYLNEVQQNINFRVLFHLMNLAAHSNVHPQVNAIANATLRKISLNNLVEVGNPNKMEMARRINNFNEHPDKFKVIATPKLPDGSPIGMDCFH